MQDAITVNGSREGVDCHEGRTTCNDVGDRVGAVRKKRKHGTVGATGTDTTIATTHAVLGQQ